MQIVNYSHIHTITYTNIVTYITYKTCIRYKQQLKKETGISKISIKILTDCLLLVNLVHILGIPL